MKTNLKETRKERLEFLFKGLNQCLPISQELEEKLIAKIKNTRNKHISLDSYR